MDPYDSDSTEEGEHFDDLDETQPQLQTAAKRGRKPLSAQQREENRREASRRASQRYRNKGAKNFSDCLNFLKELLELVQDPQLKDKIRDFLAKIQENQFGVRGRRRNPGYSALSAVSVTSPAADPTSNNSPSLRRNPPQSSSGGISAALHL